MDYQMKQVTSRFHARECKEMGQYILSLLKGNVTKYLTERTRQFWTWGARKFAIVASTDGCYGLQFHTTGLKHKGRVRVYYNPASDLFDVEFLRPRKDEVVHHVEDVDLTALHNVCHRFIERDDDEEV